MSRCQNPIHGTVINLLLDGLIVFCAKLLASGVHEFWSIKYMKDITLSVKFSL